MKPFLACAAFVLAMLLPPGAESQVSWSITIAPPPLPVYVQPQVPGEGYIWVPGYWAWSPNEGDYYWVPGTWVLAPHVGDLWTPGYWAFENAAYFWRVGYWGRSVGYYGGLNYGHGYTGSGYQGGHWDRGHFRYNRSASNVDVGRQDRAYSARVVDHAPATHASFHGGPSGPRASSRGRQGPGDGQGGPTPDQVRHEHQALTTPAQRATVSHGMPPVAATRRPSEFAAPGVERARAEPAQHGRPAGPAQRSQQRPGREESADRGEPPRQEGPRR